MYLDAAAAADAAYLITPREEIVIMRSRHFFIPFFQPTPSPASRKRHVVAAVAGLFHYQSLVSAPCSSVVTRFVYRRILYARSTLVFVGEGVLLTYAQLPRARFKSH